MSKPLLTAVLVLCLAGTVCAQERKRIDKAADLPRFTYKIDGKLDDLVANDAPFAPFARGSAPRRRIGARAIRHRRTRRRSASCSA